MLEEIPYLFEAVVPYCPFLELVIYSFVDDACMDARVSELRVVELLDGLCAKMKGYIPNKVCCFCHSFPLQVWCLFHVRFKSWRNLVFSFASL